MQPLGLHFDSADEELGRFVDRVPSCLGVDYSKDLFALEVLVETPSSEPLLIHVDADVISTLASLLGYGDSELT